MRRSPSTLAIRLLLSLGLLSIALGARVQRASAAGIIYVNSVASGANNGTSWTDAYQSLQTALIHATSGKQIWVAKGTYKPTAGSQRAKSFALKDGVAIYGGFSGVETKLKQRRPSANRTILSGDIGTVGKRGDNSYHVVVAMTVSSSAVLDGFWISDGNANGGPSLCTDDCGGGMLISNGSPALRNLVFASDAAASAGGGLMSISGSPKLTNITFAGNKSLNGGGVFISGGNPEFDDATFNGNQAAQGGGALTASGSSALLQNVTFTGNTAANGGAVYTWAGSPTLNNATFSGNSSTTAGGAIYNASGGHPVLANSIFWGDGTEIYTDGATVTVLDSIVEGLTVSNCVSCVGVTGYDPVLGPLRNNGGFTKTMAPGVQSGAIDRGGLDAGCLPEDQRGVPRPQGVLCDRGAYEVRVARFRSSATYDGWVLESHEGSGKGGSLNHTSPTLRVGDDSSNRQYRTVLSFNTGKLPDAATAVIGFIYVRQQAVLGTDPFTTHGTLLVDLKKPYFGTEAGLQRSDFQAPASIQSAGEVDSTLLEEGWYGGWLYNNAVGDVSTKGITQVRLRFSLGNNNDGVADYLSLYSGNAPLASRPWLIVYYNP